MGISISAVKMLLHEAHRRPFAGSLLTLGRQDVFVTAEELEAAMIEFGRRPPDTEPELSTKPELAKGGFISDKYLYSALGFSQSAALDASSYESADICFDLNLSETPSHFGQWDVIFDGGTIEHVFHIPNALSNIFRLLNVDGRIIHVPPSSNHMDHGFYMFSPTLFWDYYQANNFEINTFQVFRYLPGLDTRWQVCDYVPGALTRISMGGLDDALYALIVVATKTPNSTCNVIPQQGLYANALWKSKNPEDVSKLIAESLDPDFAGKGLGLKIKYLL